jgi:hypothetical protein
MVVARGEATKQSPEFIDIASLSFAMVLSSELAFSTTSKK